MANGEQDAYQERHETDPVSPMSQAQAGTTGGAPAPTPAGAPAAGPQQQPSLTEHVQKAVTDAHKIGTDEGEKKGRDNHPWNALFNVLAGGDKKLVGYAQEGDINPETNKPMKSGEPIYQKRAATEKWAGILAGAIAGAAAGHGPHGTSAAAAAGLAVGEKRVAGQKEQAKEMTAERRAEQAQKAQLSHLYSETAKNHMIASQMGAEQRKAWLDFNKPIADAYMATGNPELRVGEGEASEYLKQDPEHPGKYVAVLIGERDARDPKTGKPLLDENGQPKREMEYGLWKPDVKVTVTPEIEERWNNLGVKGAKGLSGTTIDPETYRGLEHNAQRMYGNQLQDAQLAEAKQKVVGERLKAELEAKAAPGEREFTAAKTEEARGKAEEARAAAKAYPSLANSGQQSPPELEAKVSTLHPEVQKMIKHFSPAVQSDILSVAEGRSDSKSAPSKTNPKTGQLGRVELEGYAQMVAESQGRKWSPTLYEERKRAAEWLGPGGKGGDQIRSLNTFIGHAGRAMEVAGTINQTDMKFANRPLNWVRKNFTGNTSLGVTAQALTDARDEYLNFLKGGHAPDKAEIERAQELLSEDKPLKVIQENLKFMVGNALTRTEQIDEDYKTVTGERWPNLIRPDAAKTLRKLGYNPSNYGLTGGTFGGAEGGKADEPPPPEGATQTYRDKSGKVAGWAVNGSFVAVGK